MKNNDPFKDLHIGSVIKEIAIQKGIPSKKIAEALSRYQQNADKIFRLKDIDIEDAVRISYLLEYNILDSVVKQYLSHLPCSAHQISTEACMLKIDMRTQRITTYESFNNCNFLKKTHIGQHIKELAKKQEWNEQDMAKQLHYSQGWISILYRSKSLKVKTLMQISDILQYNFIAEVYLSQMIIVSSLNFLDDCILAFNPHQIRILDPKDKTLLMLFQRNDYKKHEKYDRNSNDKS